MMILFSVSAPSYQEDAETGLTMGAGLFYDVENLTLRFDYGWADHGRLKEAQRVSFGVNF